MQLGVISKPHGLKGALNIIVNPGLARYVAQDNPLFIDMDGQRVPFFVQEISEVADDHFIVKLEFITSLEEAKSYTGKKVYLEEGTGKGSHEVDPGMLIGYRAIDRSRDFEAVVHDFIDQDRNPLLVLDADGKELLVPMADELILAIDKKGKVIHLNLPEGLEDLNP
jgi:16S rRNA processing protein RimM